MNSAPKKRQPHHAVIIVTLAAIFSTGAVVTMQQNTASSVYTLRGKVTEKLTSCEREFMRDDGSVDESSGICDGGNSLLVNDIRVRTGGGSLAAEQPAYISDISSVHAGDEVEITYIKDGQGYSNTNCKTCNVTKITHR